MSFPFASSRAPAGSTYRLGRVLGIELRVHPWFLYVVGFFVLLGAMNGARVDRALEVAGGTGLALLLVTTLVVLHELGHALVARRLGIEVIDITLWPLGGMARMSEIPEDSRIEGLVAIAGPAVNLVLASVGIVAFAVLAGFAGLSEPTFLAWGVANFLAAFVWYNLMLGIFNLLPAFPMDGGRLLRAWLGRNGDWLGATERAVRVSRLCAFAMIFAFFFTGWFFLPLIGVYVLYAGTRELWAMRLKHAAHEGGAGGPGAPNLSAMFEAMRRAGMAPQNDGDAEGAHPADHEGNGLGAPPVESDGALERRAGGFSEEDVAELERFRGRLRRPAGEQGP